jgi:hypothetical protein
VVLLIAAVFAVVATSDAGKVISNWWAHRTTNSTKRVLVFYPNSWPAGEYRNCMVDTDYTKLDCSGLQLPPGAILFSSPDYGPFTIDVRFSGDKTNQHWTCHNGNSLVCKN